LPSHSILNYGRLTEGRSLYYQGVNIGNSEIYFIFVCSTEELQFYKIHLDSEVFNFRYPS